MSEQIQIPVLIAGLATKVDGSIKITLETRELKPRLGYFNSGDQKLGQLSLEQK